MGEEFWKILGSAIGGGGAVAALAAVLKFRLSRGTQAAGLHRTDLQAHGLILDRQEKQIHELQGQHMEAIKRHVDCLESNSKLQVELGMLRESVRRVDISARSAVAIVSTNPEGVITGWNDAAVNVFHWTAEEAIGQPITILTPPRFKARHLAAFDALVKLKRSPTPLKALSLQALTREGIEIDVTIRLSGWENGDGWHYAAEISRG